MEERSRVDEMIEEEKNRILDFDPRQRAQFVRSSVDTIIVLKRQRKSKDEIKNAHTEFYEKYPKLFEKLFEPGTDMQQIDYMINMLGSIGTRGRTLHDASRSVGQKLADRYVTGPLGKK